MKRKPIDVTEINFSVAEEPKALTDYTTKQPKIDDKTGRQIWSVKVLAQRPGEISIIPVSVPASLEGLKVGDPVTIKGLVADPWVNQGGALVERYEATSIEAATKARAA